MFDLREILTTAMRDSAMAYEANGNDAVAAAMARQADLWESDAPSDLGGIEPTHVERLT
jgi:hypothetical protein